MNRLWFTLVVAGMMLMTPLGQATNEYVWTERACNAVYTVGEKISIYFATVKDSRFELWAYDALMKETLLASGVGDGSTFLIEMTAARPSGLLTLVLKMPCNEECETCLCDAGQCTLHIQEEECEAHCSNGKQDCGEHGVDCGGGCPYTDSDGDGVEDCMDLCPDSTCRKVDGKGCELDTDGDTVTDCQDQCPQKRGDPSNKGCPAESSSLLYIVGGLTIVAAGIIVWNLKK
jgi:hypothetical protein